MEKSQRIIPVIIAKDITQFLSSLNVFLHTISKNRLSNTQYGDKKRGGIRVMNLEFRCQCGFTIRKDTDNHKVAECTCTKCGAKYRVKVMIGIKNEYWRP
jgi:hypothetical protein